MAKFKLQPGETVLKKGPVTYFQGELGFMNALTGKSKITPCAGFLTSVRFAACSRIAVFPFGPLIWLILWLIGRKILFEVPLATLAFLKGEDTGGKTFLMITTDGTEYRTCSDTLFDHREKWFQAIGQAVTANCPGVTLQETPEGMVFTRPPANG